MKRFRLIAICLGFGLLPLSFAQDGVFTRTDTQWEIETGRSAYEDFVASGRISKNDSFRRRVQRILDQLVSAMPEKLYPFQAVVLADNDVNASCFLGGYMIVLEGLLVKMPDDCQLALVLAHELGHAVRRHVARLYRKMQSDTVSAIFVSILTKTAINDEGLEIRRIAHTRANEAEADAYGTELYLRAGFDPEKIDSAMVILLQQEKENGASSVPYYLRDHPGAAERILAIRTLAKKLLDGGLKPMEVAKPDLSVEQVFGAIPTIAPVGSEWQPVEPGTKWTYGIEAGSAHSQYEIHATGIATVGQTPVAHMEIVVGSRPTGYQIIVDGDRIWRRNKLEDPASAWVVESVFPDEGSAVEAGPHRYEYVAKESVEVPAGHFDNCLKVRITGTDGRVLTAWYAAGVGLVKRINEKAGVTEVLLSMRKP